MRRVISITLAYLSSQCKYLFPTNECRDSLESDIWVCSVYMSGVLLPLGSRANWSFQEYRVGYFVHPLAYERVGYERSVRRRKPTCFVYYSTRLLTDNAIRAPRLIIFVGIFSAYGVMTLNASQTFDISIMPCTLTKEQNKYIVVFWNSLFQGLIKFIDGNTFGFHIGVEKETIQKNNGVTVQLVTAWIL